MLAVFTDEAKRGLGVVDDLIGTKALIRITYAPGGQIAVGPETQVRFVRQIRRRVLTASRR